MSSTKPKKSKIAAKQLSNVQGGRHSGYKDKPRTRPMTHDPGLSSSKTD